jgi:hypothetical protein
LAISITIKNYIGGITMAKKTAYKGLVDSKGTSIKVGQSAKILEVRKCPCPTCEDGGECGRVTWSQEKLGAVGIVSYWIPRYMNDHESWVKISYSDDEGDYLVYDANKIEIV